MKRKYYQIFKLACPYYGQGRAAEKEHHLVVTEMMQGILKETRNVDEDVMIAASLLHDIGYSKIPKEKRAVHWNRDVKKDHMLVGAELAHKILRKVDFPQNKINKVINIIKTHDNPELGLKIKSKEAKLLKEADNLWMTTEQAFWLDVGRRMLDPEEWLQILESRFTKELEYINYLKTSFAKRRIKYFLGKMKNTLYRI